MNLRLTMGLGAVALSIGLFAASPADAVTGDALLFGEYSATSTGSCLTAPSGFNDKLQPNMPEVSTVAIDTGEEVWIFDGAGSVAVTKEAGLWLWRGEAVPTPSLSPPKSSGREIPSNG